MKRKPHTSKEEKMQAYLFVHFKEKTTPDGEQVYFGLSRDGFHWEEVNGGDPVLWTYYGDKGVRDFTITRCEENGRFYIFATDLSLSYGMRNQYHGSWEEIGRNGSKCFSVWESDSLTDWTEQRLVKIGDENFGCLWAPDIIYDREIKITSFTGLPHTAAMIMAEKEFTSAGQKIFTNSASLNFCTGKRTAVLLILPFTKKTACIICL